MEDPVRTVSTIAIILVIILIIAIIREAVEDREVDAYEDFLRREAEQEKWLKGLPVCDICGEPIQDDYYYEIGDETICEECLNDLYRVSNNCL